jgi:hypothetical protein
MCFRLLLPDYINFYKTLLYVPEFWYGRGHNSGEKERPSCMSLNFGTVGDTILVKKKDPPVCP